MNKKSRVVQYAKWAGIIALFISGALLVIIAAHAFFQPVKNPIYGVSFSEKYARELGTDPHKNYLALLDDLKFKKVRLMSYWNEHEKVRGHYDFSTLDWYINEAKKRNVSVSLAIGLRQPRWPECHEPAWAKKLSGGEWKQALYKYLETTVTHYENNSAVTSWQLENEAANWAFMGECSDIDHTRLSEELDLVKQHSNKPVRMNLSDQHGLPLRVPKPDEYGFSVYRTVWFAPLKNYVTYPTPLFYHKMRASTLKLFFNRDFYIHELQLEPWGPKATKDLSYEEQKKSMDAKQIHKNIAFARQLNASEIDTWGGEWWYWRKEKFQDSSAWEAVREEVSTSASNSR